MKFKLGFVTLSILCCASAFAAENGSTEDKQKAALHLDWLNTTIQPNQDFYTFANGNWQKNNPIPPEYASWGSFNVLYEKVQNLIHQMLIEAANNSNAPKGSVEQKVGDFYFSGMDEKTINELGTKPLKAEFDRIEAISNPQQLLAEIAHLHQIGVDPFFNFGSMQDFKNSELMIGDLMQSGLSLPNRDYYLKDDEKFKQIRIAYVNHVAKMFELLGDVPEKAKEEAKTVMAIETQLAEASMSPIQLRDPNAVYHMKTIAELDKTMPNFSWSQYLALRQPSLYGTPSSKVREEGKNKSPEVNLATPEFFKAVNAMLTTVSLADIKTYLRWQLIDDYAPYLSQPFVDERFKMSSVLTGTTKILPRWKRVVSTENAALGFAIGKIYVEKYFPPSSKQAALDILQNIRAVLRQDISTLSWMTPETRQAALKKLDLMEDRVGYPTKWRDYSSLVVDRGPYVLNVLRANEFLVKYDLDKIGKPIDRTEWAMTPQTINAYYDPSMNNLNIPAGILQPPFFDPNAPAAVNYGAIGFVMGHEMTHGFDDQGAQFDGHGNLKNWWTPADLTKFKAATQCINDQFSQYTVESNLHVQGPLVVGEATADLGGLTLAFRAFQHSKEYKEAKTIDGFTPEQQFFLGTAHVWATNIRPEQLRNQVTTDPHPPAKYRVNGSLANMSQFQAAFGMKEDSPMVRVKRCVIW